MSASELRERSRQQLFKLLERVSPAGGSSHAGDPAAIRRLHVADTIDSSTAGRWLRSRRGAAAVLAADRILANRFTLLGHPDLDFGSPIDWHLDPVSGKRAPRIHWSRIPYLDADVVGDHKVVWEINRHQHFYVLGRAYRLTGDEKYARRFAEHLESWMEENPPKVGINWASSLEVAYRAIAWIWAFEFFQESPSLTPELLDRAVSYLDVHGRHLERYLSTYFSPNTHLTGEALGLLYLGVSLPRLKRAARWRQKGWDILVEQLPKQVHPDGVYFEQASYYHRYTVDIYLHAVILARKSGIPVPPEMLERLGLLVDHLADLTRPDGTIPIIGDDDGGRLAWLDERDFMDVRSPLAVASVVFDRPDHAGISGDATEEVFWLLGPEAGEQVDRWALHHPKPDHLSRLYPVGGYAIMRDGWDRTANHAVIDCGPLGMMNCGHAHSDALAMEISMAGCAILVDPGTYTYTASAVDRDRFRLSASHNTVTVDGQSASVPAGPFSWAIRTDARCESWYAGGNVDWFVGSHAGFQRLSDPATHRRSVLFVHDSYFIVVDSIVAAGEHEAVAHWHTAIGSMVTSLSPTSAIVTVPCTHGPSALFLGAAGDVDSLEWDEDWVSPSYGSRARAPRARLVIRGRGQRELISVLAPAGGAQRVQIREEPAAVGRALSLFGPDMHDLFLFGSAGRVEAESITGQADAVLVRRREAGGEILSVVLFGPEAQVTIGPLQLKAKGGAAAIRNGAGWVVEGEGELAIC